MWSAVLLVACSCVTASRVLSSQPDATPQQDLTEFQAHFAKFLSPATLQAAWQGTGSEWLNHAFPEVAQVRTDVASMQSIVVNKVFGVLHDVWARTGHSSAISTVDTASTVRTTTTSIGSTRSSSSKSNSDKMHKVKVIENADTAISLARLFVFDAILLSSDVCDALALTRTNSINDFAVTNSELRLVAAARLRAFLLHVSLLVRAQMMRTSVREIAKFMLDSEYELSPFTVFADAEKVIRVLREALVKQAGRSGQFEFELSILTLTEKPIHLLRSMILKHQISQLRSIINGSPALLTDSDLLAPAATLISDWRSMYASDANWRSLVSRVMSMHMDWFHESLHEIVASWFTEVPTIVQMAREASAAKLNHRQAMLQDLLEGVNDFRADCGLNPLPILEADEAEVPDYQVYLSMLEGARAIAASWDAMPPGMRGLTFGFVMLLEESLHDASSEVRDATTAYLTDYTKAAYSTLQTNLPLLLEHSRRRTRAQAEKLDFGKMFAETEAAARTMQAILSGDSLCKAAFARVVSDQQELLQLALMAKGLQIRVDAYAQLQNEALSLTPPVPAVSSQKGKATKAKHKFRLGFRRRKYLPVLVELETITPGRTNEVNFLELTFSWSALHLALAEFHVDGLREAMREFSHQSPFAEHSDDSDEDIEDPPLLTRRRGSLSLYGNPLTGTFPVPQPQPALMPEHVQSPSAASHSSSQHSNLANTQGTGTFELQMQNDHDAPEPHSSSPGPVTANIKSVPV